MEIREFKDKISLNSLISPVFTNKLHVDSAAECILSSLHHSLMH